MEQQQQLEELLRQDGFEQVDADTLSPGMTVAYVETLLGGRMGDVQTAVVQDVKVDDDVVTVVHGEGTTTADAGDQVWAKVPCAICGEPLSGEIAEMYDPTEPGAEGVVHEQCGISHGWDMS